MLDEIWKSAGAGGGGGEGGGKKGSALCVYVGRGLGEKVREADRQIDRQGSWLLTDAPRTRCAHMGRYSSNTTRGNKYNHELHPSSGECGIRVQDGSTYVFSIIVENFPHRGDQSVPHTYFASP